MPNWFIGDHQPHLESIGEVLAWNVPAVDLDQHVVQRCIPFDQHHIEICEISPDEFDDVIHGRRIVVHVMCRLDRAGWCRLGRDEQNRPICPGEQDQLRSSLSMPPRIRTNAIDIVTVWGMFDSANSQPSCADKRYQLLNHGCLANARRANE